MNFLEEMNEALKNVGLFAPFFFVIGACLASFFNVVALRTPLIMDSEDANQVGQWLEEKKFPIPEGLKEMMKKISLSHPASHCYTCHNTLKWYHNIPIFSYLFLRGKCGYCKTPFSAEYAIFEFLGAVVSVVVYLALFPKLSLAQFGVAYVFFMLTYMLVMVDYKTMLLPDKFTYSLIWGGLLVNALNINFITQHVTLENAVFGMAIIAIVIYSIATPISYFKGVDALGGGDVKLLIGLGALMGVEGALFSLLASPLFGLVFWIMSKIKTPENSEFPYGPSIIFAAWLYIFYGQEVLSFIQQVLK